MQNAGTPEFSWHPSEKKHLIQERWIAGS